MKSLLQTLVKMSSAIMPLLLASSCVSYHYMTTDIHRDLSFDRTVYAGADSSDLADNGGRGAFMFSVDSLWSIFRLEKPFSVVADGENVLMNVSATRHFNSFSEKCFVPASPEMEGNPLLFPQENVSRKFRWFFTEYRYNAVYAGIDSLPVPLDRYLSTEEQRNFLLKVVVPEGSNGVELYNSLDKINTSFSRWINANVFTVAYGAIKGFLPPEQLAAAESEKEKVFSSMTQGDMLGWTPEEFCRQFDSLMAGEPFFHEVYVRNSSAIDSAYHESEKVLEYFSLSFENRVNLPGKVVRTDAPVLDDGTPVWKVDCYRLLYSDYELDAVSRETNIWAIVLTFIILAAAIYFLLQSSGILKSKPEQ